MAGEICTRKRKKIKYFAVLRKDTPQNVTFYRSCDFEIAKEETIINKDGNRVEIIEMAKAVNVLVN